MGQSVRGDDIRSRRRSTRVVGAKKAKRQAGFTLVELLVVMAILVLLASLVAPRVIGYLGSSRGKTTKVQIDNLSTSLELFKLDTGRYPTNNEGLRALMEKPVNIKGWNGPYLKGNDLPADPWGNAYHYRFPGRFGDFEVYSLGADNQQGGEGENRDVTSWQG